MLARFWEAHVHKILVIAVALSFCSVAHAQKAQITAKESKARIGEVETVCGKVASVHYADRSRGSQHS
jgi:hypothetical protein